MKVFWSILTCHRDSSDQAPENARFFLPLWFSARDLGSGLSLKGIGEGNELFREAGTHLL